MRAQIPRVVAGTVDQRGLALAQELHAHQIEAGRVVDDTAVVSDVALAVEHRHVEP